MITQKINVDDPVLGFFHNWLDKFSNKFDQIIAICLELGKNDLPDNVKVLSLGKESGRSRLKYIWRLVNYLWQERQKYDAVFVHMNQEYVILAGWWWWLSGKKVYMWRNHHAGNWLTDVAAWFCTKVFCPSKFSYTVKYKKTVLMPVGVDTEIFKPDPDAKRIPSSILFLARMSPVKKPHVLLDALALLKDKNINFTADFYGDPADADVAYYESLKQKALDLGLDKQVNFHRGVPNTKTPAIYTEHDIFVNLSSSGMYDKTIFEAMSCETNIVASNENLRGLISDHFIVDNLNCFGLADKLIYLLGLPEEEKRSAGVKLRQVVANNHSLTRLIDRLQTEMK